MADGVILGISPGGRYVGVAMIRHGELSHWKVKSYKGITSAERTRRTVAYIENLILLQVITCIACKVPHPHRTSSDIDQLINQIEGLATRHGIDCRRYSIEDLKQLFNMRYSNKYLLSEYVTLRFPQLNDILIRERKNRHRYHIRTFEAIAAGLCYHRDCFH